MENKRTQKIPRYAPHIPFPPYKFLPNGETKHPEKEEGHHFANVPQELSEKELYLYSLDLMNFDYPWEAHVFLEKLWNLHQRVGASADFLKALIKVAAAIVSLELNHLKNAKMHLDRAIELLVSYPQANPSIIQFTHELQKMTDLNSLTTMTFHPMDF